jgi:Common central domain of tyrosinase/Bacterial TSP3 repeat
LQNFFYLTIGAVLVISFIILFPSFAIRGTQSEDLGCTVEITGGPPDTSPQMYPGEKAELDANIVGEDIDGNYTWTIEGPIVKSYDDSVDNSSNLAASRGIDHPVNMSEADFHHSTIAFYWRPNITDTNIIDTTRTVKVNVQTLNGACEVSKDYTMVKSNDNINLQAEDFYVENNKSFGNRNTSSDVVKEHQEWHSKYPFRSPIYNGTTFIDFHNAFLAHFDYWRNLFGYPKIEQWNPDTKIDTGSDIDHANRHEEGNFCVYGSECGNYSTLIDPLPNYFRISGNGSGGEIRPFVRFPNGTIVPCETIPDSSKSPQKSLNDFDPNLQLLGCAVTAQYHNGIHGATGQVIPVSEYNRNCPLCIRGTITLNVSGFPQDTEVYLGDMGHTSTAPRDPLFWRLHKFIDNIAYNRTDIHNFISSAVGGENSERLTTPARLAASMSEDTTPPRINFSNPFVLRTNILKSLPLISENEKDLFGITGVPAISIEFDESVSGVNASNMIVNGSSAQRVNGTNSGPYVFIGFEAPMIGSVNVTVLANNITDLNGNKFGGDSWRYEIIDPEQDKDRDGLQDGVEVSLFRTDPDASDTDGDSMPDGFEAASTTCLDPLDNDAHIMDIAGNILSSEGIDSDGDGVTNVEEYEQGTDPCNLPQKSTGSQLGKKFAFAIPSGLATSIRSASTPFLLFLKLTDGLTGTQEQLSYNSITKEAISIINGNETRREISGSEEDVAIRTLNNSGLFETASFYSPPPNSTDFLEFTVFVMLGDKSQVVYWTDASEGVPDALKNLPYAMINILGAKTEQNQRNNL